MEGQLYHQVQHRIEQCYSLAEQQLNRTFPRPRVSFNQRGKIAGTARLQSDEIRLNQTLLNDNPDEFLSQVIPHEICHLLVWHCYGRVRPHGAEWRQMMINIFGLQPVTRHQMDTEKVAGKQFVYHCACQTHQLSIRRHNKMVRGQQQYLCRQCRQPLRADR